MKTHTQFTVQDFEGIQVQSNWTKLDLLAAICEEANKKDYSVKQNTASLINVKDEHERPKKIRVVLRPRQETETEEQERPIKNLQSFLRPHRKNKRNRDSDSDSDSRPVSEPHGDKKPLSKAQKQEIARLVAEEHDLPQEFREIIKQMNQTGDAKLVIQKMLYSTDTKKGQNRFSIPLNQLRCTDFLTEKEKRCVEGSTKDPYMKTITVKVIEPKELNVVETNFTQWNMNSSKTYVLNGNWTDIKERNDLELGMMMQLWSFRDVEENLCFALVKLPTRMEFD